MTEPYLILHKVRGEPAFDIAIPMECPICKGGEDPMCIECNEDGYWWIVSTSGHRAKPWWGIQLSKYDGQFNYNIKDIPEDWPDHYQYSIDQTASKSKSPIQSVDVANALANLIKPQAPLVRRKI